MVIRSYALCIALFTLTANGAQLAPMAAPAEHPTTVHYHHYHPAQPKSSGVKNLLIVGGACVLVYGVYDYFFAHGRKLNALIKGVTHLKDLVITKSDEIKTTVKEDGDETRRQLKQVQGQLAEVTAMLHQLTNDNNKKPSARPLDRQKRSKK